MQHFKHYQIDKKKWDTCISSSKENIVYAFSWYLDCVSPFWEGFVLEDKKNNYVAVMPLPVKKKYGISFLQAPLFAQQLGVFSTQKLSNLEFKAFLILLKNRFQLVSNCPFNVSNYEDYKEAFEEVFCQKLSHNLKKHKNHHLSLQHNYTKIRQNYKRDTKYRINQTQKQNFEVLKSSDVDLLYSFFEENVSLENGIFETSKINFKSSFQNFARKKLSRISLYKESKRNSEWNSVCKK